MTVIDFAACRSAKYPLETAEREGRLAAVCLHLVEEARTVADLCAPTIEPFRQTDPVLEQGLKGAFVRWMVGQMKSELRDLSLGNISEGYALGQALTAFTDRMIELQHGIDPNGGGQAA